MPQANEKSTHRKPGGPHSPASRPASLNSRCVARRSPSTGDPPNDEPSPRRHILVRKSAPRWYLRLNWTTTTNPREAGLFDYATAVGLLRLLPDFEVQLAARAAFELSMHSCSGTTLGDRLDSF